MTTVSLHELMPGRGVGEAVGGSPHDTMRSGGASFKTERVEVERHQEECNARLLLSNHTIAAQLPLPISVMA